MREQAIKLRLTPTGGWCDNPRCLRPLYAELFDRSLPLDLCPECVDLHGEGLRAAAIADAALDALLDRFPARGNCSGPCCQSGA